MGVPNLLYALKRCAIQVIFFFVTSADLAGIVARVPGPRTALVDGNNILRVIWSTESYGSTVFQASPTERVAIARRVAEQMHTYVKKLLGNSFLKRICMLKGF